MKKVRKITEYELVSNESAYNVTSKVNKMLNDGWELYGNLNFQMTSHDSVRVKLWFAQALVKYEKEEQDENK